MSENIRIEQIHQPPGSHAVVREAVAMENDPLVAELKEGKSVLAQYISELPEAQQQTFAHEVFTQLDMDTDIEVERDAATIEIIAGAIKELVQEPDKANRKGMAKELVRMLQY